MRQNVARRSGFYEVICLVRAELAWLCVGPDLLLFRVVTRPDSRLAHTVHKGGRTASIIKEVIFFYFRKQLPVGCVAHAYVYTSHIDAFAIRQKQVRAQKVGFGILSAFGT